MSKSIVDPPNHFLKIALREMTESDLPFLFEVYSSTRTKEMQETGWTNDLIEKFLWNQFITQHNYYQDYYHHTSYGLIFFNEQPAGRLYVSRWEHEIRVIDLALLTPFRGQGIGSYLLNQLIGESETKRLPLTIHVEKTNPALQLYQRLGFKIAEDKGFYYFLQRDLI